MENIFFLTRLRIRTTPLQNFSSIKKACKIYTLQAFFLFSDLDGTKFEPLNARFKDFKRGIAVRFYVIQGVISYRVPIHLVREVCNKLKKPFDHFELIIIYLIINKR